MQRELVDAARGTAWQRWVRQPQKVWLRRAIFQVHLWSGIGLGLYVFFISVTGSVLVYRNELYVAATPDVLTRGVSPLEAQANVPLGIWLVDALIDLHDNLLSGSTGRMVNGAGAIAVFLMCLTGAVIWWPGSARWRENLTLHRGVGWRRFTWQLHGVFGFWSFLFLLVLAASGMYLCFPDQFGGAGRLAASRRRMKTPALGSSTARSIGSRTCTSVASTASVFRATARGSATKRRKPCGRSSARYRR